MILKNIKIDNSVHLFIYQDHFNHLSNLQKSPQHVSSAALPLTHL